MSGNKNKRKSSRPIPHWIHTIGVETVLKTGEHITKKTSEHIAKRISSMPYKTYPRNILIKPQPYRWGIVRLLEKIKGIGKFGARKIPIAGPIIDLFTPSNTIYTWDILNYISNQQQESWVLSSANGIFSLERSGDSSFVINTDRAGWLGNMFARLVRSTAKYKPGDRFETPLFDAVVMQTTRSGSDVVSVRFDLIRPLSTPGWLFLCWNGESFEPLDIAMLEVGKSVELANTSDLWKSMM